MSLKRRQKQTKRKVSSAGPLLNLILAPSAKFDNSILCSSYDCIAEDYPWEYWNDRDVRTMVELGKAISFDPKATIPFEGDRHNALADAIHPARYVSAIWQRIIAGNQVLQKLMQN
ncbi:3'-5' exonuclease [Klebsiella quasipneumoniae]|uniref:3'-5' exonuclease n=1 Tax=Klebsiella pneumoniae complex TaxID=3390273 RepID=UPI00352AE10B